jgi:hypothetical protein
MSLPLKNHNQFEQEQNWPLFFALSLPTALVEVLVVILNTQVEGLEEPVIPKLVSLIILEIGVGVEVTLIDIVTHAYEVFKTPNILLKDTPVAAERPRFQLVF